VLFARLRRSPFARRARRAQHGNRPKPIRVDRSHRRKHDGHPCNRWDTAYSLDGGIGDFLEHFGDELGHGAGGDSTSAPCNARTFP